MNTSPVDTRIHVDMARAVKTCTVQVEATGVRRIRLRLRLAQPLLRLACWVGGFGGFAVVVGREIG